MNTTTAAHAARVSAALIRTWCRTGVVAAVKAAGRWVIDAASLNEHIARLQVAATGRRWITGKIRSGWFVEDVISGANYCGLAQVGAIALADHLNRRDS